MQTDAAMQKHLTILSALFLVLGFMGMLGAGVTFLALAGGGWLSGDRDAILVTSGLAVMVAGLIAALSLPTLVAGIGLARRRSWARMLTLIVAGLQLFNMPFGTALGVYAYWVLLQEEAGRLLPA